MAVLETSFLVNVLRNKKEAVELLKKTESAETVFITAPTVMELWEGALKSRLPFLERRKVDSLLSKAAVLDFDTISAKRAAEIIVELHSAPIQPEDAMIAAISSIHQQTLITRDEHFARISSLKVLKY